MSTGQKQKSMDIKDFEKIISDLKTSVENGTTLVPEYYNVDKALAGVKSYVSKCLSSDKLDEREFLAGSAASLSAALFDMVTQGLSLEDRSCYLFRKSKISTQYVLRRSYFGTEKVIRELFPECQIFASAVYEGEQFTPGKFVNGRPEAIIHFPDLACINKGKIIASYAVITDKSGKVIGYSILNTAALNEIGLGNRANPVWKSYPEEMAKKSAINRACKGLVYTVPSNHRSLLSDRIIASFNRTDDWDSEPAEDDETPVKEQKDSNPVINALRKGIEPEGTEPEKPVQVPPESEPDTTASDDADVINNDLLFLLSE